MKSNPLHKWVDHSCLKVAADVLCASLLPACAIAWAKIGRVFFRGRAAEDYMSNLHSAHVLLGYFIDVAFGKTPMTNVLERGGHLFFDGLDGQQ